MPNSNFSEESFYFLHIDSVCRHSPLPRQHHGKKPGNAIDPQRLTEKSRNQLREALRGVNRFLRIIKNHYQLDFIAN